MAKEIQDYNLIKIVRNSINTDLIDDADQYKNFLKDISNVICDHFGGEFVKVKETHDGGYSVLIKANDSLPDDGGVFADFDKSVVWIEGKEVNYEKEE